MATKLYAISADRDENGVVQGLGLWRGQLGGAVHLISRSNIVECLQPPYPIWDVYTAYKKNGSWVEGARVQPFLGTFLRTDPNSVLPDNLDNLPQWSGGGYSLPSQV